VSASTSDSTARGLGIAGLIVVTAAPAGRLILRPSPRGARRREACQIRARWPWAGDHSASLLCGSPPVSSFAAYGCTYHPSLNGVNQSLPLMGAIPR
jgi:hypothetical protein